MIGSSNCLPRAARPPAKPNVGLAIWRETGYPNARNDLAIVGSITLSPSPNIWSHNGATEKQSTTPLDKRRYPDVEDARQTEDADCKDCARAQAYRKRDASEGLRDRRFIAVPRLEPFPAQHALGLDPGMRTGSPQKMRLSEVR